MQTEGCALIVGGSVGSSFAEANLAGFWFQVNKSITDKIFSILLLEQYRVVLKIVDADEAPQMKEVLVSAMAAQKCSRFIRVSNYVGEDVRGKFFGFIVDQIRIAPKESVGVDGTNTITRGEYSRTYRYPRTSEAFDAFQPDAFSRTVVADLKASGMLVPLAAR